MVVGPVLASLVLLLATNLFPRTTTARRLSGRLHSRVKSFLGKATQGRVSMNGVRVSSIGARKGSLVLFTGVGYSCVPFHASGIDGVCRNVGTLLPPRLTGHGLRVQASRRTVRRLVPLTLHGAGKEGVPAFDCGTSVPLVAQLSIPCAPAGKLRGHRVTL